MLRLNFCVRDGNRWVPQAIVTGNSRGECLLLPRFFCHPVGHERPPVCLCSDLRSSRSSSQRFSHAFRTLKTAQARDLVSSDQDSTASLIETSLLSHKPLAFGTLRFKVAPDQLCSQFHARSSCSLFPFPCSLLLDQALDRLVSSSSIRYRTFTDDLSTLSSSRGLTCL